MKRRILFLALALVCGSAEAAETPIAAPVVKASSTASPAPKAQPSPEATRRELDQVREQMRDLGRRMADLSAQIGDDNPRSYAWRYLDNPYRGMIGIIMSPDAKGARIAAVTPGGPAAKSGVKIGDLLVAVDDKALMPDAEVDGKAVGEAIAALDDLKVGQEVRLTLLRDGKKSDIVVKAERREPRTFAYVLNNDGDIQPIKFAPNDVDHIVREARHSASDAREFVQTLHARMPWRGLNLTSLDKDLGTYFGTERGALVISADAETFPDLRSGDVVQSIDGEAVTDPTDAMRLLRDAPGGGEIKLQVMRQKKPVTLTMKTPEFKAIFPMLPPLPPAAPHVAPPAPPSPPAAPTPPTTPSAIY